LFNEEITPQAATILKGHRENIRKLNDKDFVDMESDSDDNLVPVIKTTEIVAAVTNSDSELLVIQDIEVRSDVSLPIASDSPFSNENVFQSADSSMTRKRPHDSASSGSTPRNKKRIVPEDHKASSKSPRVITKSPKSPKPLELSSTVSSPKERLLSPKDNLKSAKSTPKKSIFDDSDDSISTLKEKATPIKSPRITKLTPKKEHKAKDLKETLSKIVKKETPTKQESKDSSKTHPKKETPRKETPKKETPKKDTPKKDTPKKETPKSSKRSTPKSVKSEHKHPVVEYEESETSFNSINEELDDFDKVLKKIKGKTNHELPVFDLNLASQLGVTIQRSLPSLSPEPHSSSIETPVASSKKPVFVTPKLTPKPRLVPINSIKSELSSDSEEVEEDSIPTIAEEGESSTDAEPKQQNEVTSPGTSKFGTLFLLTFITWIVLVLSGLFAFWYREQQFLIGYCGHEINRATFPHSENPWVNFVGEYLDTNLKPECVPCPPHARCFSNLELGCFEDFVEFNPWNNFIKPYNKRCIPDTKKAEKLEIMIDVALDLLRTKNANTQCGQSNNIEESGIKLQDLHDLLLSMKAPYITIEEFDELWQRSIVELEKESEVIVRQVL